MRSLDSLTPSGMQALPIRQAGRLDRAAMSEIRQGAPGIFVKMGRLH
jgi:hypothetical protein